MKRGTCFMVFLCISVSLIAQGKTLPLRPVARELALRLQGEEEHTMRLFEVSHTTLLDLDSYVRSYKFFELNESVLKEIKGEAPSLLQIPIDADEEIILDLYRVDLYSEFYQLRTQSGPEQSQREKLLFYRGTIHGDVNSIAVVSFLDDEVRVMYSSLDGNYRMHKIESNLYAFYADRDVIQENSFSCDAMDPESPLNTNKGIVQRSVMTGNCVEVYFECDHKSYTDNGSSVSNTEAWISALFNEVSTIYDNESIPTAISDVMVWTTTDPYDTLTSTSAMLNAFVSHIAATGYDGRLAHLVSTRSLGGGIAYIDVLCSSSLPCAVSTSLSTNINPFPNYSWNINVVTHEMGHNMGSPHTHACEWNGNNTQIDDCGSVYGYVQPCYNPNNPILPEDGTIMSYCHLISGVGINFSLGFGPQPGNLIRSEYLTASCNTGTCTPPPCAAMSSPSPGATQVEISTLISWSAIIGVDGYRITIGTTPGSGNIVNNLDIGNVTSYDPPGNLPFNASIYVKIVPYNVIGNATGCSSLSFTTEPNTQPACTQLSSPANGASDVPTIADFAWTHSVGNQLGYKISMGTTPGGTDLLNLFDVGNVNTYDPGNLPANTTLYVRITPYGSSGNTNGCTIVSFTTGDVAYCASAGLSVDDEWISSVTLGSYTNSSGAQGYSNFTNQTIHVAAGGTYTLTIAAGYSGQVFNENFRVWIDLNHDGEFANPAERVFQAGNTANSASGTITIPLSASIGTTRMRVAMRYGAYSTPCQTFNWGEVEDYTVQVHCNLVSNTQDSGAGSLSWAVGCASPGETVSFASSLNGQTITLSSTIVTLDSPITISASSANNISVYGLNVQRVFDVLSGVTATIKGLTIIGGTTTDGSAIKNAGTLTLDGVHLSKHPGSTSGKLIKNTGMVKIKGACQMD